MPAFSKGYHVHKVGANADRHSDDGPPWVKWRRTKTSSPQSLAVKTAQCGIAARIPIRLEFGHSRGAENKVI
jgi:hypothetical protein